MLKLIMVSLLIAAAVAQAPVSTPQPRARTSQQEVSEKELRDSDLAFARATAERRIEGWMEYFADDAAIIREGKTLTGRQAIRDFYTPVFANRDFSLSWVPTKAEASKDGTLGYTYGDFEAKNGSEVSRGMYVTMWRKINGRWKVVLDLGSQPRQQPKEAAPHQQQ